MLILASVADNLTALATLVTALAVLLTAWRSSKKVETVKTTLEDATSKSDVKLDNITTLVNGHTAALREEIKTLRDALRVADLKMAESEKDG